MLKQQEMQAAKNTGKVACRLMSFRNPYDLKRHAVLHQAFEEGYAEEFKRRRSELNGTSAGAV
ncbi:hypothetical protein [Duganella callida]|uniref:Uncharacterized protein n=1 Tax=Duganella callida TaxID=2561932 RepID=A0A4Y9S859_9BURK|nr:hypothetical protein [Duganella callida]TFW15923.1 hypothetical protein E4L98_24820 [Duganella callida]